MFKIRIFIYVLILSFVPYQEPTYTLPVDPLSDLVSYMSQPVRVNGNNQLSMFSYNEHALLFYDLQSKEITSKIKYERQGPNGLSNMKYVGNFNYINQDTIVFFNQQQNRIFLSDSDGNIFKRTTIRNDSVGFGSIGVQKPFAYKNGSLYMQSWPVVIGENKIENHERRPNMIGKISLRDGRTEEFVFELPKEYKDKNYGQSLRNLDIIYNPKINKFIISFPLSDSIYVTDFNGYKKSYLAKSQLVKTAVEIDKYKGKVSASIVTDLTKWLSDKYERLFFDSKSGYYFRLASKGITEKAYQAKDFSTQKEVIVLDENFKHFKTLKHDGGSFLYYFFAGDKVYWNKDIVKYNYEAVNEDFIYFKQHSFK